MPSCVIVPLPYISPSDLSGKGDGWPRQDLGIPRSPTRYLLHIILITVLGRYSELPNRPKLGWECLKEKEKPTGEIKENSTLLGN